MTTTGRHDDSDRERDGRALGWASGLALLVAPWVVAGILATAVTMVGPDGWDAESAFPWALLAAFSAGIGWIVYGQRGSAIPARSHPRNRDRVRLREILERTKAPDDVRGLRWWCARGELNPHVLSDTRT